MFEIRIHSRGGQGGVTAARLLAMAALHDGKYATACPFYGAERRGAPVVSFVRIDDHPIKVYSQIRDPDLVVVLDASVMDTVDVLNGLKKGGGCSSTAPTKRNFPGTRLSCRPDGNRPEGKTRGCGKPDPEHPVIGALAKMGIVSAESAKEGNPGNVYR